MYLQGVKRAVCALQRCAPATLSQYESVLSPPGIYFTKLEGTLRLRFLGQGVMDGGTQGRRDRSIWLPGVRKERC